MGVSPKTRGRPKKLDRDAVLECAVMAYWRNGPADVSVNDICQIVQASKPGIYREFGNDDGLKLAALEAYQGLAVQPFLDVFQHDRPMQITVQEVIAFLMQDRDELGIPKGCLFVAMRAQQNALGPQTVDYVQQLRRHVLTSFARWVEACKTQGAFRSDISTSSAAHIIDALHSGAMRMQTETVAAAEIEAFLTSGFALMTDKTTGQTKE